MDIDFFAAIVRTGTVLGVDAGMRPQEVSRYLGDDPWVEDVDGVLLWDYGLVEFRWDVGGSRFELNVARLTATVPFDQLGVKVCLARRDDGSYVHSASGVVVWVDGSLVVRIVSTRGGRGGLDIPGERLPTVYSNPRRYADIVETGTVHGVDADLDPSVVRRVFGDVDYDNVNGSAFWWGYDILEIFWQHRPSGHGIEGSHFTVQTHRLNARHRRLRWTDLSAELARRGVEMVDLVGDQPDPDYAAYLQPDTKIVVMVYRPDDEVHNVHSRFRMVYPNRDLGDRKTVKQRLKHVLTLSPDERLAWIEKNKPDEDVAAWWHQHCRVIGGHAWGFGTNPDRAAWAGFAFWAWDQAAALGVPHAVVATEVAVLCGYLEDLHPEIDRPAADSVVRACLDNVSSAMDRSDKDLITAAGLHRHAVRDPALLASLEQWISKRTDIPSVSLQRW